MATFYCLKPDQIKFQNSVNDIVNTIKYVDIDVSLQTDSDLSIDEIKEYISQ